MAELNEYSLWIVPSSDVKQRFSGMIDDLAGRYEAPKFEPHMTLLGDLKGNEEGLLNKAYEIAGAISPFRIRMTEIDYLDAYFRCLFIRAEETGPLMEANEKAREVFGRQTSPKFMPHISIMYGEYPNELKERIIGELGREQNIEFDVESICFVYSSKNIPINEWRVIKEFSLKG